MTPTKQFCAALKFAAVAAGKQDLRYYLNGVRFEFIDTTLTLVGTDGSRLHMARLSLDTPASSKDRAFIVDNDSVKKILASMSKDKGAVVFTCTPNDDPAKYDTLSVSAGGLTLTPRIEDGVYPQWQRIVPAANRPVGPMPDMDVNLMAEALGALAPLTDTSSKNSHGVTISAGTEPGSTAVAMRPMFIKGDRITELLAIVQSFKRPIA